MADSRLAVARVMLGSLSAVDGGMRLTLNRLEIAGIPLAFSAVCALAGAHVLGSGLRAAPLVSVFWFGAAWRAVSAAVPLALRCLSWYFAVLPAVLAVATASGGVLAMLRPLHAARSSAPSSLE